MDDRLVGRARLQIVHADEAHVALLGGRGRDRGNQEKAR
jgi:hypothetical protein